MIPLEQFWGIGSPLKNEPEPVGYMHTLWKKSTTLTSATNANLVESEDRSPSHVFEPQPGYCLCTDTRPGVWFSGAQTLQVPASTMKAQVPPVTGHPLLAGVGRPSLLRGSFVGAKIGSISDGLP